MTKLAPPEEVLQHQIGDYRDWAKRFAVDDYVNNAPLIEKLHEEKQLALVHAADLEKKLQTVSIEHGKLILRKQRLEDALKVAARNATGVWLLGASGAVVMSIGTNVLTSEKSYAWLGGILVIVFLIMETIGYFLRPSEEVK